MQKVQIQEQTFNKISFPSYEVTYDRISTRLTDVFTPPELKEYLNLYESSQEDPKKAKEKVEAFQQKHKDLPEVYNLLSYIYVRLKKVRKAEKLTKENFEKNPHYLFAKINYADQCLRKNRVHKIPEIFDHKMQLADLYPNRKVFHFSELLGFMCLMGFYCLKIKEREMAIDYLEYAKLIDANDATVILLNRKIYQRSFIKNFLFYLRPSKHKFKTN